MWCHSFQLFEPFALAISSLGFHRGSRVILTMREFASRARKSRTRSGARRHAVRCASTRSTLRVFHKYAQRPQREIPHLRKCPYKEDVGTVKCYCMYIVGRSLLPLRQLMSSWWYIYIPIQMTHRPLDPFL